MFSEVAKGVGELFVPHRCNQYIHITYNYINNKLLLPPQLLVKDYFHRNDSRDRFNHILNFIICKFVCGHE